MRLFEILVGAAALSGAVAQALRWLRVAQREHYLAGSATRFATRWWASRALNTYLAALALAALVVSALAPAAGVVVAVVCWVAPLGLGLKGRTSPLAWTGRLRRLAAVATVLTGVVIAVPGALTGLRGALVAACAAAVAMPILVDLAMVALGPVEDRLASAFVERAKGVLARVQPRIVAITGSYGKTSTKGYVAHLLAGRFQVIASPRSFNNRAGLARTVNELLVPGTDVLVAEMGTYGPGEIASIVSWLPPEVAVMTAIGPVHLERFKRLEVTLAAKREILTGARVAVLNVDDPLLAALADEIAGGPQGVIRCSACDRSADVAILANGDGLELVVEGTSIGVVDLGASRASAAPTNVACAVGVAVAMGVPPAELLGPLASLPVAENRLTESTAPSGVTILDDTFNSNPAGARLALRALASRGGPEARRVLVTPGMIELGRSQFAENESFAAEAGKVATVIVAVARTNRRALKSGAARVDAPVITVEHREDAVKLVREQLAEGDVVLYENDLPDHYA